MLGLCFILLALLRLPSWPSFYHCLYQAAGNLERLGLSLSPLGFSHLAWGLADHSPFCGMPRRCSRGVLPGGDPDNRLQGTLLKELCNWHLGRLSRVTAERCTLEPEQFLLSGTPGAPRSLGRERLALRKVLLAAIAGRVGGLEKEGI